MENNFIDSFIPSKDTKAYLHGIGVWCVQTGHGFESGCVGYVAAEFSGAGLIYHFEKNGEIDHVHGFDGVLEEVLADPEHIDIVLDYGEYSKQEIRMVRAIKRAAAFVKTHHRPMTNAELRENIAEGDE